MIEYTVERVQRLLEKLRDKKWFSKLVSLLLFGRLLAWI